nr:hypothetical protein [Tanacetum cinerariifolium]
MARLQFCDYHNMVAILEKDEFNTDFHPMVDFIAASPLRYALTINPTIFVSHIQQFWSTARIETTDEGIHILATVDGIQRTVSESSLRRNLKLRDEDGIVSIPDTELFENLTLMGVTSPAADEGSMQHNISELTALCTSLQRQYSELLAKFQAQEDEIVKLKDKVKVLEDKEDVAATQSGDDAPIKGRSINKGEAAAERISNDSEDIARVLTSMDAATVLARGIDVPTSSGFIPTASPPATVISTGSEVGPTASPIITRRKGKEVMIARDAEVARIHVEEEIQGMIDSLDKSNEIIAKYLQEYQEFALELPLEKRIELISDLVRYQEHYTKVYKFQSQQRRTMTKGMTFEEIEAKFAEVWKQVEDFIPMGSKEETKRLKRKGLNLKKEQVKKQNSSEEAPEIKTSIEEFTEEKMKEMMQLVPVEDVYVQALQVKHPIIDWKVHTEGQRSYWQIIRLGGSSACYQFFVDLLKQLDMEELNQLWALVKEYLSIRPATNDKEIELWVELKRMYEPDLKDQLWTLT